MLLIYVTKVEVPGLMPAGVGRSDAGECPDVGLDTGTVIIPGTSCSVALMGRSMAGKYLLC